MTKVEAIADESDEWAQTINQQWNETLSNLDQLQEQWLKEQIEFANKFPQHWSRSERLRYYIRDDHQRLPS